MSKEQGAKSMEYGVRNEQWGIMTEEFSIKYFEEIFAKFHLKSHLKSHLLNLNFVVILSFFRLTLDMIETQVGQLVNHHTKNENNETNDNKRPALQFYWFIFISLSTYIFIKNLKYIWDSNNGVLLTHYATQYRL